jgi:tetratricopeptide (TPR) repeat protein
MTPEFRKVEALLALGRSDEAAALADSLPQRETPTPEYLRLRGRALRSAGRVFDAEAAFREALAMQPHEPGLLADLATTLMGQRRHREALALAREAIAIRPDVAAYHCLVGVCAEALALDDEAERELRAARELAPGDAEAHTVYGWHALRFGRVDAAESAFRDALAIHPDRVEALRGLARASAARGDWAGARARWLDALSVDPRQRDRLLERSILLGHPAMAPLLAATRVPIGVSVALAAMGAAFLLAFRDEPATIVLVVALFALAAAGPLARSSVNLDG